MPDINDAMRVIGAITDDDKFLLVDAPGTGDGTFATALATTVAAYLGSTIVLKSLFDANTMLYATSDNTPVALTVGASTFVGRKASGGITAMTATEAKTELAIAGADITNLREFVEDFLGTSTLVAGAGITITYGDPANTITIASDAVGFVTYAAGWPGARPSYDTVIAVSADPTASAPSWLAAGDFYFPVQPYETFSAVSGTSYTFVTADVGLKKKFTSNSAITATVAPQTSQPVPDGARINILPVGTGQITLTPGSGVTIHSEGGALKSAAQYGEVSLHHETGDVWYASGRLTT